jgi:hypothetical protein
VAKELHFFDGYFRRDFSKADISAYHEQFARPEGAIVGEWTPGYMHDFWTPPLLRRAAPDAKLLVLLRDPLARYQSGISHEMDRLRRHVWRPRYRGHVRTMSVGDALSRSLYGRQLALLLEHFDRSQVLVLQYERCVADATTELRRTYEFLGVDGVDHLPASLTERSSWSHPQLRPSDVASEAAVAAIRADLATLKSVAPEIDLELWPSVTR